MIQEIQNSVIMDKHMTTKIQNFLTNEQFAILYVIAPKLHWLRINPEDGVLEIFLDHHALSMFRACQCLFLSLNGRR